MFLNSAGPPSLYTAVIVAAAAGVASHLGFFIYGEHHTNAFRYLIASILSPIILFIGMLRISDSLSIGSVVQATAFTTLSFYIALFTSILTYRAFFHPLRKFPGPFSYRLSKLAQVASIGKGMKLQNHLEAEELRKKYGEFVRVGPNELAVFTPEGLQAIAGSTSKMLKAPWYDGISGDEAIRDYESRVVKYSEQLMNQIKARAGEPMNVSQWLNYYSFDVMGDLAFGKPFDMIKLGKKHQAMQILQSFMEPIGLFTPIPWIFIIFERIPALSEGTMKFKKWANEQVAARQQREPDEPDILSWLIDAEKKDSTLAKKDPQFLSGDARLIIVAGSDTTAGGLTFAMYQLAKNPSAIVKLREELESLNYSPGSEAEVTKIANAKYLNGIINEILRLYPGTPSGLLRLTPPEGIDINGTYIPGNVTVSSPLYSMGRLESCFTRAEEFIPERWVDKPELIPNKAAFAPFGGGAYACVGKQLGLMELRGVLARTVTQFDIKFATGEDGTDLLTKTRDVFTLDLGPLNLVFTERKS